ncbi:helix-turn-helix domain-containing protein [Ochrovirga pacifica]|uniref:helix-turn-helix domain-containing protein n=1 Tax=Ochrovirga pacifica TaxID=1042376 RepID=UPI0002557B4B|nr:helix-turn-helix domain-containing protein [Ochrovirga pacifica]
MKVFQTIPELVKELEIARKPISSDFFIFNFNEINEHKVIDSFPHYKRFFEILLYQQTSNDLQIGHTSVQNLSHSISFISPMQSLSINRKKNSVGVGIYFTSEFLYASKHQFEIQQDFPFFKLNTNPFYQLEEKEELLIKEWIDKMYQEYIAQEPQCMEIVQSYLRILLNYTKRIFQDRSGCISLKRYEEITLLFEELILQEKTGYQSVASYAAILNITPMYLSECVKKSTGKSAKKVVMDYQILRIKSLLIQTSKTIDEIARIVGFKESTHLIKFFKNSEGLTPKQFRNTP